MRLRLSSAAAGSPGYRADIDGLRAIAVLSVVGYHLGGKLFHGGFVGVDVFFVISGYLIAGILQTEIDQGAFTFRSFYARRIRRILPALAVVALASTGVAAVLYAPQQFADYGRSLAALAAFGSNVFYQATAWGTGYFDQASGSKLLLQTWSLSVEEQFYILFPVTLALLNRVRRRGLRMGALLALAMLSFAFSLWQTAHRPTASFYLLPSRIWELLLGVLLALRPLPPLRHRMAREMATIAGVALIACAVYRLSPLMPFPGANALYPCVGAALILFAGEGGGSIAKRALAFPPLVFVGLISYSLYLWHWPIVVVATLLNGTSYLSPRAAWIAAGLALLLGFLSYEFVESPFRQRSAEARPLRVVAYGVVVSMLMGFAAAVIVVEQGVPGRYSPRTRALVIANYARKKDDLSIPAPCNNWHTDPRRFEDVDFCVIDHAERNILVWGDSHAAQLYPVFKALDRDRHLHGQGVVFAASAGCPPAESVNLATFGSHCDRFTSFAMMRAVKPDISTVYFQFLPTWALADGTTCASKDFRCVGSLSREEALTAVLSELDKRIRTLRAMGKRVVFGVSFPFYTQNIPDFEIRRAIVGDPLRAGPPLDMIPNSLRERFRAVAVAAGADTYDPRDTICVHGRCTYAIDGVSLYIDQSHFAASSAGFLRPGILAALDATARPH